MSSSTSGNGNPSSSHNRPNTNGNSSSSNSASAPRIQQPKPQIRNAGPRIGGQGSGSTILVNSCQRGNPILTSIRSVGWEYGDIVPDYQVGVSSCVLYLSLRYHRLHPEYIHNRIEKLQNMYTLRVILVMCDVKDHQSSIKEITKTALVNSLTVVVAWTNEEAARYIESYKTFEHQPPDVIKERINNDYMSLLNSVLTSVRGVNKTDVVTLATSFGSMKRLANSTPEELSLCPGFGDIKAKRLREAFNQPFRVGETRNIQERGVLPSNLQNSNPGNAERSSTSTSTSKEVPNTNVSTSTSDEIIGNRRISSLPKGRFATAEERKKELDEHYLGLQKENETKGKEKEKEKGSGLNLDEDDLGLEGRSTGKGKGKERQIDEEQVDENQEEEEEDYLEHDLTEEEQLKLAMEMSMAEDH